ncbi:MAG: 23S rRNA (pseudouridine(1915)-N(3))-methyltransferase RlmH [Candidatus Saccharimonas sp.]
MITLLAIGKKHESWIAEGVERYSKRLQGPWKIDWVLLPHSSLTGPGARQDESERILAKLTPPDVIVLLDERGKMLDSPALSHTFDQLMNSGRRIVCIIGGAYGVNDELLRRANVTWSLSPLVFPHQLVRLITVEQLYRAQCIAMNHPYHHE